MLDNDIDGIFELTFSVEADDFGSTRIVDLKPDGRTIPVTNENKAEYVQLLVQNRLTVSIKDQIEAFQKGFDEIIPRDLVRIFSATELQLLLNGLPDINVEDWRANTELHQFQQSDSTVTWFWRAVRSFDQEERAKLLQFSTGSSRVPLEGFGALQGAQGPTKVSLTCFTYHRHSSSGSKFLSCLCSSLLSTHIRRTCYQVHIRVSTKLSKQTSLLRRITTT